MPNPKNFKNEIEQLVPTLRQLVRERKSNAEIECILEKFYGVSIRQRTLRKYLSMFKIRRVNQNLTPQEIEDSVRKELTDEDGAGRGGRAGYRSIATAVRVKQGVDASRESVRVALNRLRPPSLFVVKRAKRRAMPRCPGTNYRWATDGHDKMKFYKIYFHATIDVFSRRIMYCYVFSNNRDQNMVASHYLAAVRECGYAPLSLTADFGNETNLMCQAQALLAGTPDAQRRIYSTDNQAIERFWVELQVYCTDAWIKRLERLEFNPNIKSNVVALHAIYLPLIQEDLDRQLALYHVHPIRKQKNRVRPDGQPDMLYNIPEMFGGVQCGIKVDENTINLVEADLGIRPKESFKAMPSEIEEAIGEWLNDNGIIVTMDNAEQLYHRLVRYLEL